MPAHQQLLAPDNNPVPRPGPQRTQEPAFVARERDAAVRQVRELITQRARAEEEARKIRAELEAVTAQRDAALACVENLMQEATALAEDFNNSRTEGGELKKERDQLLAKLAELSQEVLKELPPEATELRRPGAAILNPKDGDVLRYSEFASTVSAASFTAAGEEFGAEGELQRAPAVDYFSTAAEEFFAKLGEDGDKPALFLLQHGVSAIEYQGEDEILELHHSVNLSYLSAEGREQESCQGYVCCVNRGGKKLVFAALCGIRSGKTWVYGPECQPTDDASCAKLIKDALKFTEEVGYLMERLLPGPKHLEQRVAIARRCPVLKAVAAPREAQAAAQERL